MTVNDFLWIPINSAALWVWSWWFRQQPKFEGPSLRSGAGFVALLLATFSSVTLAASVIGSWISGSFSGTTFISGLGPFLCLASALLSLVGERKLRLLSLGVSVLLALGWLSYLASRRVLL
jgi:hypothetical protein